MSSYAILPGRLEPVSERFASAWCPDAADHDLTGQILWPAATLLAEYLEAHAQQWLTGCPCAVELGSGLGMAGLLASQFCKMVILTDHNEVKHAADLALQAPALMPSWLAGGVEGPQKECRTQ